MFDSYDWKEKVILVAEDEEINYLFLEEVLNRTGASIAVTISNCSKWFWNMSRSTPDLS